MELYEFKDGDNGQTLADGLKANFEAIAGGTYQKYLTISDPAGSMLTGVLCPTTTGVGVLNKTALVKNIGSALIMEGSGSKAKAGVVYIEEDGTVRYTKGNPYDLCDNNIYMGYFTCLVNRSIYNGGGQSTLHGSQYIPYVTSQNAPCAKMDTNTFLREAWSGSQCYSILERIYQSNISDISLDKDYFYLLKDSYSHNSHKSRLIDLMDLFAKNMGSKFDTIQTGGGSLIKDIVVRSNNGYVLSAVSKSEFKAWLESE